MSNEFFTAASVPVNGAPGSAATIRAEFAQIVTAFDKMPVMAGNAGEIVTVNSTGTALEASGAVPSNFITWSSSGTLTNKVINWADNTIGTIPIEGGGTGATTLAAAQTALGIDLKANSVNAVLLGVPTAETAPDATNTTRLATTEFVMRNMAALGGAVPGIASPLMNQASAAAGSAATVSREDHVHPSDVSRMPVVGGTFTGTVSGPTPVSASDNTTKLATTAWVNTFVGAYAIPEAQVTNLVADLAAKAPVNSPTFTGTPLLTTTPTVGDNTTKIASTAFVKTAIDTATAGSVGVTVSVVPLQDSGAGAIGVSGDASRADHVHPSDTTKQSVITGAATTITAVDLTASRALVANSSGKVAVSAVTDTELGRLAGVTNPIQSQLNAKADLGVGQVWTAQQTPMNGALSPAASIAWNCNTNGQIVTVTLNQNSAMAAPSNVSEFACYVIRVTNGGSAYTLTWNAAYKFPGGVDHVMTASAGAVDILTFVGGAGNTMHCIGQAKGLA